MSTEPKRKKFTDYVLSIDSSEVSRCILCHDPVCTGVCPQKTPVGEILRSMYFENYLGAARKIGATEANAWDATFAGSSAGPGP